MEISTRMKSGIEGRMKEKHHTSYPAHLFSRHIFEPVHTIQVYITYTFEDRFLFKFFC